MSGETEFMEFFAASMAEFSDVKVKVSGADVRRAFEAIRKREGRSLGGTMTIPATKEELVDIEAKIREELEADGGPLNEENYQIMLTLLREGRPYDLKEFVAQETDGEDVLGCDLCGAVTRRMVQLQSEKGPVITLCLVNPCGQMLFEEDDLWDSIVFEAAQGKKGVMTYLESATEAPFVEGRQGRLIRDLDELVMKTGGKLDDRLTSIVKFFKTRGYMSLKQQALVQSAVNECRRRL